MDRADQSSFKYTVIIEWSVALAVAWASRKIIIKVNSFHISDPFKGAGPNNR